MSREAGVFRCNEAATTGSRSKITEALEGTILVLIPKEQKEWHLRVLPVLYISEVVTTKSGGLTRVL